MNKLQKFLSKVFMIPQERQVVYSAEEELIKKDELIKAVVKENQTLKGQIAKYNADQRQEREVDRREEQNEKVAEILNEQESELNEEKVGNTFSFNKLYKALYGINIFGNEYKQRSWQGKKLEIADKNDEVTWIFGEILYSDNGLFYITDIEGDIIAAAPNLSKLIYKPETLSNQLRRGRILLSIDKNGKYVPDFQDIEVEVPVWNEEKRIYETSQELRAKAIDVIAEKDEEIRNKVETIERLEMVQSRLKSEMMDLKRAKFISEETNKISQTELSKAMNSYLSMSKEIADMQRNITNLTENKSLFEDRIRVLEDIVEGLLDRFKKIGSKATFDEALDFIKDQMEFMRGHIAPIISPNLAQAVGITTQQDMYPQSPKKMGDKI